MDLTEPRLPWAEGYTELDSETAIEVVQGGLHLHARQGKRNPELDETLVTLLHRGLVACAYRPDGALITQATKLAEMQHAN